MVPVMDDDPEAFSCCRFRFDLAFHQPTAHNSNISFSSQGRSERVIQFGHGVLAILHIMSHQCDPFV